MAETEIVKRDTDASLMEKAVIEGDLSGLTPKERVAYYAKVCESLGLNPFTKPFAYMKLNNRLVLYPLRDCTDQLRHRDSISLTITARETIGDVYVVTAKATTQKGRTDEATGAVPIKGIAGEFLANAYMKAETKAKRRVTLSIVGLGWLDEMEVETIVDAKIVEVSDTGEIMDKSLGAPSEAGRVNGEAKTPAPTASRDTFTALDTIIKKYGADSGAIKRRYQVSSLADLTEEQAKAAIQWIEKYMGQRQG